MTWTTELALSERGPFDGFAFDTESFDIAYSWLDVDASSAGWTAAAALGGSWTPEAAI